jgi:hypothetical protein
MAKNDKSVEKWIFMGRTPKSLDMWHFDTPVLIGPKTKPTSTGLKGGQKVVQKGVEKGHFDPSNDP